MSKSIRGLLEDLRGLVEGDVQAQQAIRAVKADPQDVTAWEKLIAIAERAGQRVTVHEKNGRGHVIVMGANAPLRGEEEYGPGLAVHDVNKPLDPKVGFFTRWFLDRVDMNSIEVSGERMTEGDEDIQGLLRAVKTDRMDLAAWQKLIATAKRAGLFVVFGGTRPWASQIRHDRIKHVVVLAASKMSMFSEPGVYGPASRIPGVDIQTRAWGGKTGYVWRAERVKPEKIRLEKESDEPEVMSEADEGLQQALRDVKRDVFDDAAWKQLISKAMRAGKTILIRHGNTAVGRSAGGRGRLEGIGWRVLDTRTYPLDRLVASAHGSVYVAVVPSEEPEGGSRYIDWADMRYVRPDKITIEDGSLAERTDLGDDPTYYGWSHGASKFASDVLTGKTISSKPEGGFEVEILPYAGARAQFGDRGTVSKVVKDEREAWAIAKKLVADESVEIITFIQDGKRKIVFDNGWKKNPMTEAEGRGDETIRRLERRAASDPMARASLERERERRGVVKVDEKWFETFLRNYFDRALRADADTWDFAHGSPSHLSPDARKRLTKDARDFVTANWRDLHDLPAPQAGVDFHLTRNRHGTGDWDRHMGNKVETERGKRLTDAAHGFGEVHLYVGDDYEIHAS